MGFRLKTIKIKEDTWRDLSIAKIELNTRSYDKVINHLLKEMKKWRGKG
jgi:predicted CopG family antitoxin